MNDIVSSIINSSGEQPGLQAAPEDASAVNSIVSGESKPEEPKEDERLSSRFAALSKKERQLLEREQKLKAEREEYEEYKRAKEGAKQDPLAFLEKSGLKLEDVIYSGLGSKPEQTIEDKIKQLQDRIEQKELEEKTAKEQSEKQQMEGRIGEFKASIDKHIKDNSEKYELINLAGAQSEVYSLIEAWLDKTTKLADEDPTGKLKPVLMSIEEASDKIEKYYEEHMGELFNKSKKLASKYKPIQDVPKPNPTSPTLTNRNSIATSNATPADSNMSFEQKREASLKRSAQLLQELQQRR